MGSRFAIGVGLNLVFVVAEVIFGLLSNSMALLTDAAHNVSDVLGLALAWWAANLARRPPSERRTYGLRKSTVLSALANAILVLVAVGAISWEAVGRLAAPPKVEGTTMMVVAGLGVVINSISAMLFFTGRKRDVNLRAAFVHLAADAAVSLGVVFGGVAILLTGRAWIDPGLSLLISVVIVVGTWSLLRQSLDLALDAVPRHVDPSDVGSYLQGLEGVVDLHDLHIWAMSSTETALTAHLTVDCPGWPVERHREVALVLEERFQIHHATLQLEPISETAGCCPQSGEGVV